MALVGAAAVGAPPSPAQLHTIVNSTTSKHYGLAAAGSPPRDRLRNRCCGLLRGQLLFRLKRQAERSCADADAKSGNSSQKGTIIESEIAESGAAACSAKKSQIRRFWKREASDSRVEKRNRNRLSSVAARGQNTQPLRFSRKIVNLMLCHKPKTDSRFKYVLNANYHINDLESPLNQTRKTKTHPVLLLAQNYQE